MANKETLTKETEVWICRDCGHVTGRGLRLCPDCHMKYRDAEEETLLREAEAERIKTESDHGY
jgi:hypothetical protein